LKKERTSFELRKTKAEANIKQYKAQRVANTNALNDLAVKRKKDKAAFRASVRDHEAIIGALDQVIASLAKLRGSVSGIGRPKHVREISQEKRDAAWRARMKKSFLEIVGDDNEAAAFAELATEADQDALERLIALLNRIQVNVKKSLADDAKHEKESRAIYKKLKVTLEKDNAVLDQALTKQGANLERYIKKINELTVTIKIRKSLLKTRKTELANTRKEKIQKQARYNRDKAKRSQEEGIIRKLQKIVKDRLARMSQFLRGKVNQ